MRKFSIITSAFLFFVFTFPAFSQLGNYADLPISQNQSVVSKTWEVRKYDLTATLPQAETDRNLTVKAVLSLRNASSRPVSTLTLRISPNA